MKNSSFLASPLWALASVQSDSHAMAIMCGILCGICFFCPFFMGKKKDNLPSPDLVERIKKVMSEN